MIDCTCPEHNSATSSFHPRHVLFSIYLISCILRIELGFHFHKSCASLNIICSAPVEGFLFSSSVVGFVLPTDVAAASARQGNFLRSISPSACAHLDSRSQSHFHSDSWYSHTNVRRNHKLLREVCNIIPEICVSASPLHSHPSFIPSALPALCQRPEPQAGQRRAGQGSAHYERTTTLSAFTLHTHTTLAGARASSGVKPLTNVCFKCYK